MFTALDHAAKEIAVDALHCHWLVIDARTPIGIVTIRDDEELSARCGDLQGEFAGLLVDQPRGSRVCCFQIQRMRHECRRIEIDFLDVGRRRIADLRSAHEPHTWQRIGYFVPCVSMASQSR